MSLQQKISLLAISICVLSLSIFSISFDRKPPSNNYLIEKIHGFNLVAPRDPFSIDSLIRLKELGAQWVAVVPYAFCDPESTSIIYGNGRQWWGETPDGITHTIKIAHSLGLKVMLKPHLWVKGQGWAGDLSFTHDSLWTRWEENYFAYINTYTGIAQNEKVELFCIGTEVRQATKSRENFWNKLIDDVRSKFNGQLTYAANWDEFEYVTFWDKMDFIGIDAYFPLNESKLPSGEELVAGWKQPIKNMEYISNKYQKPILFTEYGYESIDYPTIGHWNVNKDTLNINFEAQKRSFEALYENLNSLNWWAGGFVWKWHLNYPYGRRGLEKSYTPQNKPAMEVISKHFLTPSN